jgi:hypothetical protein
MVVGGLTFTALTYLPSATLESSPPAVSGEAA